MMLFKLAVDKQLLKQNNHLALCSHELLSAADA